MRIAYLPSGWIHREAASFRGLIDNDDAGWINDAVNISIIGENVDHDGLSIIDVGRIVNGHWSFVVQIDRHGRGIRDCPVVIEHGVRKAVCE